MTLLIVVIALISPNLSGFFRGRTVDSEAHRFLALTLYGQSRAVSEGAPMLVWIDPDEKTYGLLSESAQAGEDPGAREYRIDRDVRIQVQTLARRNNATTRLPTNLRLGRNASVIRLQPDGFITETSPVAVSFRTEPRAGERDDPTRNVVWVGQSRNRLNYELQTNQALVAGW